MQRRPARILPDANCRMSIEAAAPLDVEGEGCDVVGEEVLCDGDPVCDGEDEDPLSIDVRVLSDANWAETPEEFVQVDGAVPFPATKFTVMH